MSQQGQQPNNPLDSFHHRFATFFGELGEFWNALFGMFINLDGFDRGRADPVSSAVERHQDQHGAGSSPDPVTFDFDSLSVQDIQADPDMAKFMQSHFSGGYVYQRRHAEGGYTANFANDVRDNYRDMMSNGSLSVDDPELFLRIIEEEARAADEEQMATGRNQSGAFKDGVLARLDAADMKVTFFPTTPQVLPQSLQPQAVQASAAPLSNTFGGQAALPVMQDKQAAPLVYSASVELEGIALPQSLHNFHFDQSGGVVDDGARIRMVHISGTPHIASLKDDQGAMVGYFVHGDDPSKGFHVFNDGIDALSMESIDGAIAAEQDRLSIEAAQQAVRDAFTADTGAVPAVTTNPNP